MDRSSHHNGIDDESRDLTQEDGSTDAPDSVGPSGRGRFDLKAWVKKNPKAVRLGGGVAVLVVLIVVLLWFFVFSGGDKKKRRRPVPQPGAVAQQGAVPDIGDDDDDEASPDSADAESAEGTPEPTTEKEPEPEAPPLPEDVATWEQEHYDRARREGDAKLFDAIGHLGRNSVHDEAVVKVLAAFLQPLQPEEADDQKQTVSPATPRTPVRHGAGQTTDADKLAEAVVEALATNDTPAAREVLEQIIAGTLATEGDELKAVETALNALVGHPTTGNEDLLFRLLTATDQYRKPAGSAAPVVSGRAGAGVSGQPLSVDWLRGRLLGILEKTASVGFRAKLAGFLIQPTTPLAWRAEMGKFLLEPSPDNLGAQFVMYQGGRLEDDVRVRIEQHFASRSAQAIQAVLGVPHRAPAAGVGAARGAAAGRGAPAATGRGVPTAAAGDIDLAYQLARQLWGERSTEAFAQHLADVDRRDDPGHLLALCATMPAEAIRSELLKTLRARHGHGPDALEKAGVPGTLVSDPGFLLVVKSLDRQEPQAPTAGRPAGRAQPQAAPGRAADAAGQKWMKFSETLVRSWCEKLDAAAQVQAEKARLAGKNPAELRRLEDLPVNLHDGAEVRSAYHLVLPGPLAEKLSGAQVGPMRIQYVRTEDRTSIKRVLGYYRRVLSMRDGRPIDNGVWFDSYRSAAAPGVRCSLDVLIRLADKKAARDIDLDADENLVIEVLSIEAREPQ
ncbi:MAG: hypothetical protein RBS80_06840 [Thermoguttaceae bacterium]|jgi:hypothetical protein|nr:hypothetical protein [Thermoguttaceae bacterium]